MITLSKSDYLIYRECRKNAWLKTHRPSIYYQSGLSEFDRAIIESGNLVELEARKLFPNGELIQSRDQQAQETTHARIASKAPVLFQPVFSKDNFLAALDILKYDAEAGGYFLYEVKASNQTDERLHVRDLAFQYVLLEKFGITVSRAQIIHLNSKYVRAGKLDITHLFIIDDVTDAVRAIVTDTKAEMETAQQYLSQEHEPKGHCDCIKKGRSNHCSTFHYSNPDVPEYGIHDIARIGSSKSKLSDLADRRIFRLEDLPADIEFSEIQTNQINAYIQDRVQICRGAIAEELSKLVYPIYFLDYETCPSALPRFDGFSPYQQIPFQYSIHILDRPDTTPRHAEFLSVTPSDPSPAFAVSLRGHIGDLGSVVVWNKSFESKINRDLGKRIPAIHSFMDALNSRIYDLMEIFSKQHYVHKDFKGGTSIKDVLPVLVPELSYQDLAIQEGGTASQTWDKITSDSVAPSEKEVLATNLKAYCERDTYAMYAIWQYLYALK